MQMNFNTIIWDIDPTAFSPFGLEIRWYGILLATGFYLAYMVISKLLTKEGFTEKEINKFSMYVLIGTIAGLRLGHCFFYEPMTYLKDPISILNIRQGGLASHGGAMGILIAMWMFARKKKLSYLGLLDRVVIIVPLAGSFVRIGNLMNSEIVGKTTNASWGFFFPRHDCNELKRGLNDAVECVNAGGSNCDGNGLINHSEQIQSCDVDSLIDAGLMVQRHPAQLYESFFYILLFVFMILLYRKNQGKIKEGFFLGIFITLLFGFRFFIEFFKDVQVDHEIGWTLNTGQWLSIPFVIAGIALIYISQKRNKVVDFTLRKMPKSKQKAKI
jgi:prolipoprotein diacylglyceryl transferase